MARGYSSRTRRTETRRKAILVPSFNGERLRQAMRGIAADTISGVRTPVESQVSAQKEKAGANLGHESPYSGNQPDGVQVHSDMLQRYQDHGRHLIITSPVR